MDEFNYLYDFYQDDVADGSVQDANMQAMLGGMRLGQQSHGQQESSSQQNNSEMAGPSSSSSSFGATGGASSSSSSSNSSRLIVFFFKYLKCWYIHINMPYVDVHSMVYIEPAWDSSSASSFKD